MTFTDFLAPDGYLIQKVYVQAAEEGIRSHLEFSNESVIIIGVIGPPIEFFQLLPDNNHRGVFGYVSFGQFDEHAALGDLISNGHYYDHQFINWKWQRFEARGITHFVRIWCRSGVLLRARIYVARVDGGGAKIMGQKGWYAPQDDPPPPP